MRNKCEHGNPSLQISGCGTCGYEALLALRVLRRYKLSATELLAILQITITSQDELDRLKREAAAIVAGARQ